MPPPVSIQNDVPIPVRDALVDKAGSISFPWLQWLQNFVAVMLGAQVLVALQSYIGQTASLPATDITRGNLAGGIYRIEYYVRVTTPATVASSIQVAFTWKDGVTQTFTGAVLAGNTVNDLESNSMVVAIEPLSPIQFSTTYASAGATAMQYKLFAMISEVSA